MEAGGIGGRRRRSRIVGFVRKHFNTCVVFLFVALWHDMEPKLLAWAALNAVFMVIEGAAVGLYRRLQDGLSGRGGTARGSQSPSGYSRAVEAVAGATYILVLMGINLTGYGVGIDGALVFLRTITHAGGATSLSDSFGLRSALGGAFLFCFASTQIMFELRRQTNQAQSKLMASTKASTKTS